MALGIVLPLVFMPTLQSLGFSGIYDFLRGFAPVNLSMSGIFLLLLVNFISSYLFSIVIVLFARPTQEEKGILYFIQIFSKYFLFVVLFFPIYSFFMATHLFSPFIGAWTFAMLFFFDAEPTAVDLRLSIKRGLLSYLRFLPIIIIVQGLFEISFYSLAGLTSFVVQLFTALFSEMGIFTMLVSGIMYLLLVACRMGVSILTGLLPIVVVNTLYIKAITRFKAYFE
ncbi:hypothetical protein FJ366_01600 [Candidatus Dependentiae bacterium]|nr:hypothetical protein [Candidatus Dependentiae bacterium]